MENFLVFMFLFSILIDFMEVYYVQGSEDCWSVNFRSVVKCLEGIVQVIVLEVVWSDRGLKNNFVQFIIFLKIYYKFKIEKKISG